jgi:hypothetical protein
MLPAEATFAVYAFNGKYDLLQCLPNRLKGYRAWNPQNYRIIVLVDEDREDCVDAVFKALGVE